MRRFLSEHDARRLLVPAPVVLVTTKWRAASDVMPVAWSMPLSAEPPFVGICVHSSRHTHDMIKFSEEFALNFPSRALLNHVQYFGSVTGKEVDKLDISKLPTFKARKIEAPLLEGCVGFIECGLEDALRLGDHTLFVGRVVAVTADEEAFNETWLLREEDEKALHYLGGSLYSVLSSPLEARPPAPESDEFADEWAREAHEIEERGQAREQERD
jgi:flavin reductase (DIM6/NTAB) family NADH-FMN oxidoreductase RutF